MQPNPIYQYRDFCVGLSWFSLRRQGWKPADIVRYRLAHDCAVL